MWSFVVGGIVLTIAVAAGIGVWLYFGKGAPNGETSEIAVTGDRGQWTDEVCAPHSELATSSNFVYPEATNLAYCASATAAIGSVPQPMIIGEWPRDADLDGDVAGMETVKWFATATVEDTTTAFILIDSPDRTLLEPLVPFGFTIHAPA
ncbi:hypothetical protein SAMN04488581_0002 [Mycolicibacterium neoaurum]|nr:hypothetical protein SAMN04488581_0002 [Mycolicibacterium neoaurum]